MKRFLHTLIAIVGCVGISFIVKDGLRKKNYSSVVVQFPLFHNRATISLEIEGKKYSCLLDTGSSHFFDLKLKHLQKITHKERLGTKNHIGFRGKSYLVENYRFPEVKMPNLVMNGLVGCEESIDFLKDSAFSRDSMARWIQFKDRLELWLTDGSVGWRMLRGGCPLFDLTNMHLCFAKDLPTLIHEAGYSLEGYSTVPFELANCGIVLTAETQVGIKRLMLDTGATHSILRGKGNESLDSSLIIAGQDFGRWRFRFLDLTDLFDCDGVLGIDFFLKHKICLDFPHKRAYIKQNHSWLEKRRIDRL